MKKYSHLVAISLSAFAATMALASLSSQAHAFCGFYVAPTDEPLYNDASMVALMREGTRTVISMSNNYKGPAHDFAMVVPVPVVLQKENVKTLPLDIFKKLEQLSAPRLVEYWEQDPCAPPIMYEAMPMAAAPVMANGASKKTEQEGYGVKIEAKFTVGEYNIVILSAEQSDGLERWLRDNKYNIPKGASSALAPYIKEQQKFFVAKVNLEKVTRNAQGVAVLSPLRFHYEESNFRLPVRLGLLNAQGKQDLIVYVLAKGKRYEVANYTNVFIPTNLDVKDETRNAFGSFYATLFDAAMYKAGGRAVVTEYAWQSTNCDPCPVPPLEPSALATLGGDVLFGMGIAGSSEPLGKSSSSSNNVVGSPSRVGRRPPFGFFGAGSDIVLTRLHTRYDAKTLNEDLVFKFAEPVVGGREFVVGDKGELEQGVRPSSINSFQARYAIRHAWTGPIACAAPRRGIWGGPPNREPKPLPKPATDLASSDRGFIKLASHINKGLENVSSWDEAAALANASTNDRTKNSASTASSTHLSNDVIANPADSSSLGLTPISPRKTCGCKWVGNRESSSESALFFSGFIGLVSIYLRRMRKT